ncbi:hypothetical protein LCGC14_1445550 [marine sediment metagenome]|uniref:Uncharacterized protein n=1 Tax=marine sediment metagenome TaxID=412755 RepID=A0A0F9MLB3_9ZZZZ
MKEDGLSAFALHTVTTIAMMESLAVQYDKMAEEITNMSLMIGEPMDAEPLEATAISLREMKQNQMQQVADFAESDTMVEFLDAMKLHCMWVPK